LIGRVNLGCDLDRYSSIRSAISMAQSMRFSGDMRTRNARYNSAIT
jgi:hypothetical protein